MALIVVAAFAPAIGCVYGHKQGSKYSEVEFHDVNVRMRCYECEVRLECLADALESEANYGVWGGLTERERRAILRHYPHAENWWEWLCTSDEPLARELRSPHVPKVLSFVRPQMAGG